MNIINNQDVTHSLHEAICSVTSKYDKGDSDITATTLIDSPLRRILYREHGHEIEVKSSDLMFRFYGHLAHSIVQQINDTSVFTEERLYAKVMGTILGGQVDEFDGETVTDYKFTNKANADKPVKPEWEKQLNVYAYLIRRNGFNPTKLQVQYIFRDAYAYDRKAMLQEVMMWKPQVAARYVVARVKLHKEADSIKNKEGIEAVPVCTSEERWTTPARYALMKRGIKKAIKLYNTKKEVEDRLKRLNSESAFMEERPEKNIRCMDYCEVNKWCVWWQNNK